MSRLTRQQYSRAQALRRQSHPRRAYHPQAPRYRDDGTVQHRSLREHGKRLRNAFIIIFAILAILYVPGWFMKATPSGVESKALARNPKDCSTEQSVLQKFPTDDWDNDGLTNQEELKLHTDPLIPDTDGDGAYDSYEKQTSHTDPTAYEKDILNSYQKQLDKQNGNDEKSPFLMNNVKLWADDMDSKAHAGVVETTGGYNFSHFNGLAQFPLAEGWTAYTVIPDSHLERGKHVELDYEDIRTSSSDSSQKTRFWKINAKKKDLKVELYPKPLESSLVLSLGSHSTYLNYNIGAKFLAFLLPEKGWLTAEKVARTDVEYDTSDDVTVPIQSIPIDSSSDYRFRKNSNSLADLKYVFQTLDNGKQGVPVFLYDDKGGALGIIYGYQKNGNLMVADYTTLRPMGVLQITERARKVLIQQNQGFMDYEYFDYSGLGFDSTTRHTHICFLSPSVGHTKSTLSGTFGDTGVGKVKAKSSNLSQSSSNPNLSTPSNPLSQTLPKEQHTVPSTTKMNQYGFANH